jgi:NO-binding membrane sensor protein with MHYT domain
MTLHGHYNLWLVFLSYCIAVCGSYAALGMVLPWAGRLAIEERRRVRGVLPSGVALGVTIWAMHFTGMAAFSIDGTPISYDWAPTILSMVVAVLFTLIGFAALTLLHEPTEALFIAGVPMASGILSMHFLGMMVMSGEMRMHFDASLVVAAGLIALVASIGALWMTTLTKRLLSRIGAALVMGAAICGMHYTGMAAAHFSVATDRMLDAAPG